MFLLCFIIGFVESSRKGDKDNNAFNNSSTNDAITKMVNPGDRINIPCSVGLTPGGSVQWVQNGKPILLVSRRLYRDLTECWLWLEASDRSLVCFCGNHINSNLTYQRIGESLVCQRIISKTKTHFQTEIKTKSHSESYY